MELTSLQKIKNKYQWIVNQITENDIRIYESESNDNLQLDWQEHFCENSLQYYVDFEDEIEHTLEECYLYALQDFIKIHNRNANLGQRIFLDNKVKNLNVSLYPEVYKIHQINGYNDIRHRYEWIKKKITQHDIDLVVGFNVEFDWEDYFGEERLCSEFVYPYTLEEFYIYYLYDFIQIHNRINNDKIYLDNKIPHFNLRIPDDCFRVEADTP
jgi:hypothetical protein